MADVGHEGGGGDAGDGGGDGGSGGGGPSMVVASVDKMAAYIRRVVPVLIEPEPEDVMASDSSAGSVVVVVAALIKIVSSI